MAHLFPLTGARQMFEPVHRLKYASVAPYYEQLHAGVKYLIRQGPKDLRLFLSLFTHNELGRLLLPEIYYLGGVPLTSQVGKRGRRTISPARSSPRNWSM